MKIQLSDKNKKVRFSELDYGDVFKFHNFYYIKSVPAYQDMLCVNLSDGTQRIFEDTVEVEIVDCEYTRMQTVDTEM